MKTLNLNAITFLNNGEEKTLHGIVDTDVAKEFKHLVTFEITSDGVVSVGTEVDKDGKPFEAKKFYINAYIAPQSGNNAICVAINSNPTTLNGGFNIVKFTHQSTALGAFAKINIRKDKNWTADGLVAYNIPNLDGMSSIQGYAFVTSRGASAIRTNEWDNVNKISFCCTSTIPVGSIFEVYAR